ncbi:MAG TPA: glycosyltransferase family 4 protein [Blastocatellia bacterium]|nr:glycosyltransferase family 4 protein [Blastocatellia bacterium]
MKQENKRKLRIGHVAPVAMTIPAPKSGSVELVSSLLTEELVRRGHEVTLFATGDSHTSARLAATFSRGYCDADLWWPWEQCEMINLAAACERADEFDVIQCQAAYYPMAIAFSRLIRTPMVHTLHLQPSPEQLNLWQLYPEANYVPISNYQRQVMTGLNCAAMIPHGLDLQNFPFSDEPQDYCVFMGRFNDSKGVLAAIEISKRAGTRLLMAAPEDDYYHERVKPHVDGEQIVYVGEVGHEEKMRLLGGAQALLYPMQVGEPFGLVMIEAMACGTPVAALDKGAVTEIVQPGLSGYFAETLDELIELLPQVMALPRAPIRRYIEANYSLEAMTDGYESLYYRLAAEHENGGKLVGTEHAVSGFCASR